MRIEQNESQGIERVSHIAPLPAWPHNAGELRDGEFLMATAQQIDENAVVLRTADGRLFRAALQGEMRFFEGDMLEAVVSRSDGKCFLYILNVSRAGMNATSGNVQSMESVPEQSPGGMISQQTLSDMLALLKRNPEMDTHTALFLAENSILDTAENMTALAQLSRSEGIGTLLGQILGMIAQDETVPMPQAAAVYMIEDGQIGETVLRNDVSMPDPGIQAQSEGNQSATIQLSESPVQSTAEQLPEFAVQHNPPDIDHADALMNKPIISVQMPQVTKTDEAESHSAASVASDDTSIDTERFGDSTQETHNAAARPSTYINKMIQELFLRPDEQMNTEIKKMATEIWLALKTLKSQLNQTDIKNKELCLKSIQAAIRQIEVAESALRFEHMQIPLAVRDGEYQTAELYVFRRKGGQKNADSPGISIVVALNTQRIGRVEAMVREVGGNVSIEFRLEQTDIAESLKRNSARLTQSIEAAGYRDRLAFCRTGEKDDRT